MDVEGNSKKGGTCERERKGDERVDVEGTGGRVMGEASRGSGGHSRRGEHAKEREKETRG